MHLDTSSVMLPGVIGCFGSFNNQTPSPRRPSRGWSSPSLCPGSSIPPTGLLSWSTVTLKQLLLPLWPTWWPFAYWFLWCRSCSRPCIGTGPQTLCIPPQWACTLHTSRCFGIFPPALCTLPSSSRWPPQCGWWVKARWVPRELPAWRFPRSALCLAFAMLWQQQLRMCSRVPLFRHREQAGDSNIPQENKLDGLDKTS